MYGGNMEREHAMKHFRAAAGLIAVVMLGLLAGCGANESNETKLKEFIDEKNKDPSENRLIDLTNIIRITEQEIKYSKEDLESAEKSSRMWTALISR